jgi:hypothetical protein
MLARLGEQTIASALQYFEFRRHLTAFPLHFLGFHSNASVL